MNEVIFEPKEHKYFSGKREFPSITFLLKHFGMCPDYDRFGNDTARDFGTHAHAATALLDQNNLGEYHPDMEPWLNGYRKFLHVHQPEWTAIEKPFISFVWGFAGMPDRFGMMSRKTSIVEIKFGAENDSHELQTAGQQILIEEYYSVRVQERYSLYVKPNDFRLVKHSGKTDKSVFLGMVQTYSWKQKHNLI